MELSTVMERSERAGLPQEKEQLCLVKVELEVVGQHPSQTRKDACRHLGVRRGEGEKEWQR